METERESLRQTYQLCRLGFGILSVALLLACPISILMLAVLFGARHLVAWLGNPWWWHWSATPVVWGSLIGTYLLWGRWNNPGWQRRVGLLIVMGLVDVVLWGLDHGGELGLSGREVGHEWLRDNLGQALGWAEFALIASLSGDVLAHLGVENAREASKSTRALAAIGAVVWLLLFCLRTSWRHGWPLQAVNRLSLETLLLYMGSTMIWTITLVQVTALTIAASRQFGRVLAEMDREDQCDDLFRSRSETFAELVPPTG